MKIEHGGAATEIFKSYLGLETDQELQEYMDQLKNSGGDCVICGRPFNASVHHACNTPTH